MPTDLPAKWVQHVLEEMVPKLESSRTFMALLDADDGPGNVKFWVELGAAISMDKPIIAVVVGNARVSKKIKLVADEIVRLPEGINADSSQELARAVKRVLDGQE